MPASSLRPAFMTSATLFDLLAHERDAHRRQRELVRASLMACPGDAGRHQPAGAR